MSRTKELIKNTGILMIGRVSTHLISFILLPLYTALLSTSDYGEIDIYTSLTMIVIPFLTLQLEAGLFRFFISEKTENNRRQIITTSFCIIAGNLVFTSFIYVVLAAVLNLKYRRYIYFYYISMAISTVLLQVCRAYGNNVAYAMASFICSALAVCLNVLFIAGLHWKVEGILLSSTLAQAMSTVYILVKTHVFNYFDLKCLDKDTAKRLLEYSFPLVFNQVSSWAINYSDRLIILTSWGTSANGIYSLANKFSNITDTFFNIFNVAWSENVVRYMNDKDSTEYINRMFAFIYQLYFALVTGIINLLPGVFHIMVHESYNGAYEHIPILLLAMFFSGMAATIGSVYIAYNKTKEVSISTIAAGICNVTIHLTLLRVCGLYAASISTLISFALLFLYRYIFARKFFGLIISVKKLFPQVILYMFAWVAYCSGKLILIAMGLAFNLLYIGYILIKNRNMIYTMLRKN